MSRFFVEYGWTLLVIVAGIAYFVVIYRKQGKEAMLTEMREKSYELMLLAEKNFLPNEGDKKFEWVAERVYVTMPDSTKLFVNQDQLRKFIQELYDEANDFLDDGELNDTF